MFVCENLKLCLWIQAVIDAIIKDGLKRRAGGILPPYNTETLLLKLCEDSEATKTLVRKLTGSEIDENIFEVHKPGAGNTVVSFFNMIQS